MDKINTLIDINKRIKEVNNLNTGMNRDLLVSKLKNYIGYLTYTGNITSDELDILYRRIRTDNRQKISNNYSENGINNFIRNNQLLMNYYEQMLDIYDRYRFNYVNDYCDYKNISIGLTKFLKKFNLYNIFKDLLDKKMIGKNINNENLNLTINDFDDSYIIIGNFNKNNLSYYYLFAHEMGHVLTNKILKEKRLYQNNQLIRETIPITFERYFAFFLEYYNIISDEELKRLKNNIETNLSAEIEWTYETTNIIKNENYKRVGFDVIIDNDPYPQYHNLYIHYYIIGNIISLYLLDKYKSNIEQLVIDLPNIINELNNMTLKEIFNNFFNIQILKDYLKNNFSKKVKSR